MGRPDIERDASLAFEAMRSGGIAIIPNDTGYGILASASFAVQRINRTKGRGGHKRNALVCNLASQQELQLLDTRGKEIVSALTLDFDLPVGVVAPYRADHQLVAGLEPQLRRTSTADDTIGVLLNAGPFYEELTRLSRDAAVPLFGSSANITGSGAKYRIEDIEPEIRAIADVTIDHGLKKYHAYQRSGTIIDFRTLRVIRIGACYELISDVLLKHFDVTLPADPGVETLRSGHLDEFGLERLDVQ